MRERSYVPKWKIFRIQCVCEITQPNPHTTYMGKASLLRINKSKRIYLTQI